MTMIRWARAARIGVLGFIIAFPGPAAADPFVLFLLRMMRDQAISSAIEAGATPSSPAPKPQAAVPPREAPQLSGEGQWLKSLIDESFVHLGSQQREELHASLVRILGDPNNAAVRSTIIAEFTAQAVAMRDAHRQLSRLTEPDMRRLALEARVEFARLPPDQRQQLMQALQQGVPGMPRAFNDMLLAEFGSVAAAR